MAVKVKCRSVAEATTENEAAERVKVARAEGEAAMAEDAVATKKKTTE